MERWCVCIPSLGVRTWDPFWTIRGTDQPRSQQFSSPNAFRATTCRQFRDEISESKLLWRKALTDCSFSWGWAYFKNGGFFKYEVKKYSVIHVNALEILYAINNFVVPDLPWKLFVDQTACKHFLPKKCTFITYLFKFWSHGLNYWVSWRTGVQSTYFFLHLKANVFPNK